MIKKALVFAVMAVSLGSTTAAFAQHQTYRTEPNAQDYRAGGHDGYDRHDRSGRHDGYDRHDRYDRGNRHHGYRGMRGAGPRHDIYRGAYLPQAYRGSRYVVSDWHHRRLSAPPYGYHWVQAGNDTMLVAIATGIIAQVLLNH